MNRHERRAARAEALRKGPVVVRKDSDLPDRMHLLQSNMKEVLRMDEQLDGDSVIVVCDSRDNMARKWVTHLSGLPEERIRQHEAACFGRVIPTFFLGIPRAAAVDLTAENAPMTSEMLEAQPSEAGRVVLVIAAQGTSMFTIAGADAEVAVAS